MTLTETKPNNCCSRCYWWIQKGQSGWGDCKLYNDRPYWYRNAPCIEYELDPYCPDTIDIEPTDTSWSDEIHNDH